jgi:hypothetical protein
MTLTGFNEGVPLWAGNRGCTMLDQTFIDMWVTRFRQTATTTITKGQKGEPYEEQLHAQVDQLSKEVSAAFVGKKSEYLQAIAGQLDAGAVACEISDPQVPGKLNDAQLNVRRRGRAAVLREAIRMIRAIPLRNPGQT